jgi:hypothetical protein
MNVKHLIPDVHSMPPNNHSVLRPSCIAFVNNRHTSTSVLLNFASATISQQRIRIAMPLIISMKCPQLYT